MKKVKQLRIYESIDFYNRYEQLSKKYQLDGYNEGLEIVSRKATDFDNIKTSTFESYCNELINKYKVGTKITAPKYSELNGKTLQGKYKLEVPKSNEISSKLNEFKEM
ncbi:hypothetical protein [Chishuiella sp.]|uniref:hypothetical protein n=1 Tax=Chishuiella sp. TaxID=1969467 RepID=UPI0028AC326B|nr:hypothetical protein [Chishuiella sp.]